MTKETFDKLWVAGMQDISEETTLRDIEKFLLKHWKIVLKPEVLGSKLLKFSCHPYEIIKVDGKVVCHVLCKYTDTHKFVIDAYEAGIMGALEYIWEESNKNPNEKEETT